MGEPLALGATILGAHQISIITMPWLLRYSHNHKVFDSVRMTFPFKMSHTEFKPQFYNLILGHTLIYILRGDPYP